MKSIFLKAGREKSLLRKHPWIFSGAIDRVEGNPSSGETVAVFSHRKEFLARGAWSPLSQIRVRAWSFQEEQKIDSAFFRSRLQSAIHCRQNKWDSASDSNYACRLVYAENDGLPGLIVDKYGNFIICQFLTSGSNYWKDTIINELQALLYPQGIYERSEGEHLSQEGLAVQKGRLMGEEPPDLVEIKEQGCRFLVDLKNGHKTGFYLDQRENRQLIGRYSQEAEVLNCFAYTGGFSVPALLGGAKKVINIDTSAPSLELAARNLQLNGINSRRWDNISGDAFAVLRQFRADKRKFDLIILDPPKFADSRQHLDRAARGYKDINLLAMQLLNSNGILFTFSCSGLVTRDLFQKIVAGAALDSGREVQIIGEMNQAPDHPIALNFPEGLYLKGLICRVC
ncbi:MAG: class I SAM-dependent methyltransferase [Candidatus Cloacimonetes bacterium]|nr:class I SAM-dependent methyltransferase [Candidatus Cloacimonadota bacterium]